MVGNSKNTYKKLNSLNYTISKKFFYFLILYMKKIPKKYTNITFSFLLAAMMSFFMSCFVTFRNIGFSEDFFARWMTARW